MPDADDTGSAGAVLGADFSGLEPNDMRRLIALFLVIASALDAQGYTVEQVKSYPFPTELTAAAKANRIAWALDERGLRNIYVAEGPDWTARKLTNYRMDDGQELTSVSLSSDGRNVVYVRGGEHSANWDGPPPNPTSLPTPPKVQVWTIPFGGGEARLIGEGDSPTISPTGTQVAFVRDRAIWIAPVDGSSAAKRLISANGSLDEPTWSPDGARIAFVSNRGDHSFIGVFTNDSTPITWLAPSTSRDGSPRWSPDGTRVAYIRRPGAGGAPDSTLVQRHNPWAICVADVTSAQGRQLWKAPETLRGSVPSTQGGTNLNWAAQGRIVFLSYVDGWPHLYSISENGGEPLLLTPGRYMAEYISLSPDGRTLVFAGNAGSNTDDIDRRHVVRVPVDRATPEVVTAGKGLEWTPVITGTGTLAYISATAQRPPMATVWTDNAQKLLASDRLPSEFPAAQLVTPKKVVFKSPDGVEVHAQMFVPSGSDWSQARDHLRPRRPAAADAARLALLGLLLQRVRAQPVSRESRLRRAVGELPARHRLRS